MRRGGETIVAAVRLQHFELACGQLCRSLCVGTSRVERAATEQGHPGQEKAVRSHLDPWDGSPVVHVDHTRRGSRPLFRKSAASHGPLPPPRVLDRRANIPVIRRSIGPSRLLARFSRLAFVCTVASCFFDRARSPPPPSALRNLQDILEQGGCKSASPRGRQSNNGAGSEYSRDCEQMAAVDSESLTRSESARTEPVREIETLKTLAGPLALGLPRATSLTFRAWRACLKSTGEHKTRVMLGAGIARCARCARDGSCHINAVEGSKTLSTVFFCSVPLKSIPGFTCVCYLIDALSWCLRWQRARAIGGKQAVNQVDETASQTRPRASRQQAVGGCCVGAARPPFSARLS